MDGDERPSRFLTESERKCDGVETASEVGVDARIGTKGAVIKRGRKEKRGKNGRRGQGDDELTSSLLRNSPSQGPLLFQVLEQEWSRA